MSEFIMKNMIIGLTGGIGSGKSLAGDFFSELGIDVIDSDKIAREIPVSYTHLTLPTMLPV